MLSDLVKLSRVYYCVSFEFFLENLFDYSKIRIRVVRIHEVVLYHIMYRTVVTNLLKRVYLLRHAYPPTHTHY